MILRLDKQGLPLSWVSPNIACQLIASERVVWQLGPSVHKFRGGINRHNEQSEMLIPSIIATTGGAGYRCLAKTPPLTNYSLFSRDRHTCLYCGKTPQSSRKLKLTRDHVIPTGQGGLNVWVNVVTACSRCNHHKACRTPSQANMPLLAVPYTPNYAEGLILRNRNISVDQMDFLKAFCKHKHFLN